MSREVLESLTRRELQILAKEKGLKANSKSSLLIEAILEITKKKLDGDIPSIPKEEASLLSQTQIEATESESILHSKRTEGTKENDVRCHGLVEGVGSDKLDQLVEARTNLSETRPSILLLPNTILSPNEPKRTSQTCKHQKGKENYSTPRRNQNKEDDSKTRTEHQSRNKSISQKTDIRSKFDKAHEKIFSNQRSIVETYGKHFAMKTPGKCSESTKKRAHNNLDNKPKTTTNQSSVPIGLHPQRKPSKRAKLIQTRECKERINYVPSVALKQTKASEMAKKGAHKTTTSNPVPFNVGKSQGSGKAKDSSRKFDLEKSLKRPITWEMKRGPLR